MVMLIVAMAVIVECVYAWSLRTLHMCFTLLLHAVCTFVGVRYILDYKAPISRVQAFGVALCQFLL